MAKKLIVGISGASGAIYGIRFLEILKQLKIESHLVISKSANLTIKEETDYCIGAVKEIADFVYSPSDIGARISSGSFQTDGMVVLPCSMKSLSAIANGYEDNLLARAASVTIKEQKKLVLMIRETPLHAIHLENMLKLAKCGVAIAPAVPAFYNKPTTIDDLITHSLARILDLFNIDASAIKRWDGMNN
jgi:flavin prenyltransferase